MALKTTAMYTCGGNIFWADPLKLMSPGVPLNQAGIKYLQDYTWNSKVARPEVFPGITHVVVHDTEGSFNKGQLLCLSPEEPRHAFILHLGSVLAGGTAEEEIQRLLCLARSCVMQFQHVPTADSLQLTLFHKSVNIREHIGAEFESMYTTAIQRCFQVLEVQARLSAASKPLPAKAADVQLFYDQNIKVSSRETMSLTASGVQVPQFPMKKASPQ